MKLEALAGHRYWCEDCGTHRMSGGRSSGEHAYDFLLELRDEISARALVVEFDHALEPWQLAVVAALGARPRFRGNRNEYVERHAHG